MVENMVNSVHQRGEKRGERRDGTRTTDLSGKRWRQPGSSSTITPPQVTFPTDLSLGRYLTAWNGCVG